MLSNKVLRFIDRLLRDLCNSDLPFGGKVLVLGGDWKQLAPVVETGVHEDAIQESIKMDSLFQHFEKLRFVLFIFFYLLERVSGRRTRRKAPIKKFIYLKSY